MQQQVSLSQQQSLRDAASQLLDSADELVTEFERGGRDPTAAENVRLRSMCERATALRRKANGEADNDEATDQRSRLFRAIRYLTLARGKHLGAEGLARAARDTEVALVIRAAAASADTATPAWAGVLVAPALGEFIGLLRPQSALFAIAPNPLPLVGVVNYPRLATGAPSGFVEEGKPIPVRQNTLETLTLTPFKAAGIVVASGELVNRADRFAETFVLGTLSSDISLGVDQVFLSDNAASAAAPAGIFHSTNAVAPITAAAGGTAAAVAADISALLAAGSTMVAPKLLINPAAIAAASALTGSSGYAIITGLATGNIGGVEVIATGNITTDTIALIDADGLLVASGGFQLFVSMSAALHMDSAPSADLGGATNPTPVRSMFQTDQVACRVLLPITWRSKRTSSVQHVLSATWV